MVAVAGSGIRHMSDSLMAFQPAIEEPSNICPSENVSSPIRLTSKVTCCHLPRGSVNRKSTYLTSLSLIIFKASLAVVMEFISFLATGCLASDINGTSVSDGVQPGFPRSNPDGFLDIGDEDFAVADPSGLGGAPDRLDGLVRHVVGQDNLDLHLGQKIHDIFCAAIELGMAFLPAESLGFGHGDALQPDVLQRLLHFVELEGLYDRLDLFHLVTSPRPAGQQFRLNRASG